MKRRNMIITAAVAALSVSIAVIVGLSVSNMSASGKKPEAGSKEETDSSSVAPAETEASSEEETEAPSETEEELNFHMKNTLRELTADQFAALSSLSNEIKRYYTKPDLNDKGRPIEASYFEAIFKQKLGTDVRIMNTDDKRVTLSFALAIEYDENTDYVLNYLSAKDVKAVFFVSYSYAFNHPEIIRRILLEGHTLGSMGYSLPESGFARLSLEEQYNDLKKMHDYVYETYGYSMDKFFYGDLSYSLASMGLLRDAGYQTCFYTVSYNDTKHEDVIDAAGFLDAMSSASHKGAIYVLHTTNTASLIITPSLIDRLREQDYEVGVYN